VKIFAYEHITGSGSSARRPGLAPRRRRELMLRSLIADLAAIAGVHVKTSDCRIVS
jgi:hypothetical protein